MFKVKGKKYRRVAKKKDGKCPKGSMKIVRGRSRRETCVIPVKAK